MIFRSEKMQLEAVRTVMTGDTNDVYICRDILAEESTFYTVLKIKEHDTVFKLIDIYEDAGKPIRESCVDFFTQDGEFVAVYPYMAARNLRQFYMGESKTLNICESICINLIVNCFSCGLPYPLLYLVLTQDLIHLAKDDTVYFSYEFNLADIDAETGEKECTLACANLVLELLSVKKSQKVMSYQLIEKRLAREDYSKLTQLHKDIRISAVPQKKHNIWQRIKAFFRRHRELIFRICIVVAIILAIIVIISLITQAIFGDIPWLRLFVRGFRQIGTQSLV